MIFTYLDLPSLPSDLFEDLNQIEKRSIPRFPINNNYKQYKINEQLNNIISDIFPFETKIVYQVILPDLKIHKDKGRSEAFNYILKTGDATTIIYKEDQKSVLFEKQIEPFRWHFLDVSKFHTVTNLRGIRLSITVSPIFTVNSLDLISKFIIR